MTRIDFYHYAEDKQRFACRLAAKAFEQSKRVIAWSPDPQVLADFDRSLWTFQSIRFVPHCMLGAAVASETPVILAASGDELPHHDVLINLSDEEPPFFPTFERLLEIVSAGDEDKQRARGRYASYKKRGYEITVNAIEG
ncbi:DNA polymerase III subunit chi [Usitatibacter palustris]|uniref:DNA polymerase III subunit chi n=1 Tax=Usitatibacter palustris TaxID=2732487 RepID=A0A6M4H533_9PROT|nr:DNA polymerase III subunit chi [Usitatibacter palustris]QJR14590.1 DNA polymerase III subunit chi [Usitatibacter palustris]